MLVSVTSSCISFFLYQAISRLGGFCCSSFTIASHYMYSIMFGLGFFLHTKHQSAVEQNANNEHYQSQQVRIAIRGSS